MLEPTYPKSEPPSIRDIRVSGALCDRRAYVEPHRRAKEQAGGKLDVVIQLVVEEAVKCEAVARGLKADAHQRMRRNGYELSCS